jgi:hypothetical protein
MLVSGNLPGSATVPARPPGTLLVAAIDVEWSKNYRIRGGNVPFCYSAVWLALPQSGKAISLDRSSFWYTAAYVQDTHETKDLVAAANRTLTELIWRSDLIAGHQLSSDLAVLATAAGEPPCGVAAARTAWHERRLPVGGRQRILDTRYDAGHVLACESRRLVDVCADLRLDVTQPELRGTSMTALHRRWLETGDAAAREKIAVLNLRHSLSTVLVAARAAGLGSWQPGLNVNRLLAAELGEAYGWLASPAFAALLGNPGVT